MSRQTNPPAGAQLEEFKQLVRKYRICWEVWPEYLMVAGNKRQVGFELVLVGAHEEGTHPTPGCPKCLDLFQHLKEIAIHRAVKRRLRPEVMLSLKILHRQGYDQPVDACEVDCLNEMQDKLKNIGAQRDVWQESK